MATEVSGIGQSTGEVRTHYCDFVNDLPTGVTVASATATHVPPSGVASTPTVGVITGGSVVPVTLGVQTVAGLHQLIVTATLSDAQKSILKVNIDVVWAALDAEFVEPVRRLRRMVAESPTGIYPDLVLVEYIERYPLDDIQGEAPQVEDAETGEYAVNPDWIPTYDLNAAAADIWDEKASAIAGDFDFTADGGSYHRSQAVKNYENRARHYRSRRSITSITQRPEPLLHGEEELDD